VHTSFSRTSIVAWEVEFGLNLDPGVWSIPWLECLGTQACDAVMGLLEADLGPVVRAGLCLVGLTQMPDWEGPFNRSPRAVCTEGLDS